MTPIGLRKPKYSPFGQGHIDRPWTEGCAPVVVPNAAVFVGRGDPKLEEIQEKRMMMKERIQGKPFAASERKALVFRCQKQN